MKNFLNAWNKTNKELVAGFTTFFTISYIVIINPLIWSTPGTGVSLSTALTATVLILVTINLLAGFLVKLPYAFGPGMGLNAFVVYTVILSQKIPFPTALGMIFWSSILFILISILPIRKKIIEALPENMKHAMSCGIGLFLAFIGFKNLHLIASNPTTLLQLGHLDFKVFLGFLGFCIAFYFFYKQKPYAFLLSIIIITIIAILTKQTPLPEKIFSYPDFSGFAQIDIFSALKLSLLPTIISLLMTNLFDSISTIVGLSQSSGLREENGNPKRLKQLLFVDSFGSFLSSFIGTSPTSVYIESATGIHAGGRTGLVPIIVAICFIPCLFLEPIVRTIPRFATAPILIFVGVLMSLHLKGIKTKGFDDIIPVFVTIIFMPLTSSVTYGVIFGIISYVAIKVLAGKRNEISATLWVIAIISLFVFVSSFTKMPYEQSFKTAQANAQKNKVLSGDFEQEYYSAIREKTTTSNGQVFLKNDLFRWEVKKPREQLYVNDGKYIWKYEKEFKHVEQFEKNSINLEFLNVLSHLDQIEKYYKISEITKNNSKDEILTLTLIPKSTTTDQRLIDVLIEVKTGYVTLLNMSDENGNKTKITFDHFSKTNLKNDLFVFIPPKDAVINKFKN